MIPNDNIDPARHARNVLRHVLGKEARQLGSAAHTRLLTGLAYARAGDTASMDQTLANVGADVVAVAKRILRDGRDLTEAGKALGGYATDIQARAWAKGKLQDALNMLTWHPERITKDELIEKYRAYAADQRAIKAAKAAVPFR